jgi:anti-sigma regulatory factor (Ser/Thr protein kinase)
MMHSLAIPVHEQSQVGDARRMVGYWARNAAWSQDLSARVALVLTELGNNLALHTKGGTLVVRPLSGEASSGVEILSLNRCGGVTNFQECVSDGFSTAGTSGIGLGAVARASQYFDFHSAPGTGTAILSGLMERNAAPSKTGRWEVGAVNVPVPPEIACGDSWESVELGDGILRVLVADGLGHGELAAEASGKAVEVFLERPAERLEQLMERIHGALRTTRGAALAIAEIDPARQELRFTGVGNISGCVVTQDSSSSLISMNGTLGLNFRAARTHTIPWPAGAMLLMASDGLKSHTPVSGYPGIWMKRTALVAGILYRDYLRGNDDATAVVVRARP